MLSLCTPPDSGGGGGVRRSPHCRTCGKPMKGHKMDLCQLRSPSAEESSNASYLLSGTTAAATVGNRSRYNFNSFEPPTPTNTTLNGRIRAVPPPVPFYPPNPISPEPSWEVPPHSTFYHRKNPYLANDPVPLVPSQQRQTICRTASWVSTEKADSVIEEEVSTSRQHQLRRQIQASESRGTTPVRALLGLLPATPSDTPPPTGPQQAEKGTQCEPLEREIDAVDSTGKKVLGINFAALGENLKAIIRQADEAGYYATVVRPRIGFNRGSVDIRTDQDADKHTTIFVSTAPDTISINLMCSEALRKAKLVPVDFCGSSGTRYYWVLVFLAMFFASLFAMSVNRFIVGRFFL